jgi:hypothetical protein
MSTRGYVSPSYFASVHAGLGDSDATFERLEQARAERSGALAYLHVDPQYARLRSDPRFVRLVETIGIAPAA